MKTKPILLLFICIGMLPACFAQENDPQDKPNILLFMVDQMIPMYSGPYGSDVAITPNLDRLAKNGVVFEKAYSTCPVCVPARYSLLTGMYLASHGAYDNGGMLRSDIPTHNHYLNLAGYETTLSGKGHFIGPDQLHGFTRRLLTNVYPTEMRFMHQRNRKINFKDLHPQPIAIDYIGENAGPTQEDMLLDYDEKAVFHAIRYLSEKRSNPGYSAQENPLSPGKVPFFLQISLNNPHEPFLTYQEFWDMYEGVEIPIPEYPKNLQEHYTVMDRQLNELHGVDRVKLKDPESLRRVYRAYYATITYVDHKLGEVLSALERFGLKDNTIIIFLSDHGDMLGQRGMVQKRVFYEHSARIPMIVHFPKNFPLGKNGIRCPDPVSIVDVAPTILELAGIRDYLSMDGKSLLPQLNGRHDKDRFVFCENYSEGVSTTCIMVRQRDYKYTYIYQGEEQDPQVQLFNIIEDPSEWTNLAGKKKCKSIETELRELILARFDPAAIDREAQLSFERRKIIHESRKIANPPKWDYRPVEDIHDMYWR